MRRKKKGWGQPQETTKGVSRGTDWGTEVTNSPSVVGQNWKTWKNPKKQKQRERKAPGKRELGAGGKKKKNRYWKLLKGEKTRAIGGYLHTQNSVRHQKNKDTGALASRLDRGALSMKKGKNEGKRSSRLVRKTFGEIQQIHSDVLARL